MVSSPAAGRSEALSGYHHFHYPALLLDLLRRGRVLTFARELLARRRLLGTPIVRSLKDVARLVLQPLRRHVHRPDWLADGASTEEAPSPGLSLTAHQDHGLSVAPLPGYNHHADRNSMTFSLETRNPFLDVRVVEAARALHGDDLLHGGYTKWALREGVRDLVPSEVVDRADKQGFTTDERLWFRDRLGDELAETFASESVARRGYFDQSRLLAALTRHRTGANLATELWRAYVVERWLRLFVDPEELEEPSKPSSAVETTVDASDKVVRLEPPPTVAFSPAPAPHVA